MSFKSTPNAQEGGLFDPAALPQGRRRMLPFGAAIGAVQAALGLADQAPWPVWSGSTRKPVQFQPMTRREAVRRWHDARHFERQTREKGKQDGALGRNGLAVLHALLFDFLNHRTGQLDPTRATLVDKNDILISDRRRARSRVRLRRSDRAQRREDEQDRQGAG